MAYTISCSLPWRMKWMGHFFFFDVFIIRAHKSLVFRIFRKPMATDIFIHSNSYHAGEHKMTGIKYPMNTLTKYPVTDHNRDIGTGGNRTYVKGQ
jgi:hypothetical protein